MDMDRVLKGLDGIERSLDGIRSKQREQDERLLDLEQRRGAPPAEGQRTTLGGQFAAKMREHADLLAKTGRLRLELKAATDPVTTTSGRTIQTGNVGAPQGRVLGLQYGLPRRAAGGTSALEYSRFTGTEGGAAQQATEGAAKAYVRPGHTLVTQSALTVSGLTQMSKQALNDSALLARAIDVTLMRSVDTALDALLVSGGTGFTGGFEALATAHTSTVYDSLPDAVSEAVAAMQQAGFNPDVVAMTPADWLAVAVARGASNDHYLSGSYLGPMPMEMRSLRVVLSADVTAGKAIVLDSTHAELLDVDMFTIEAGFVGDDFMRNLLTLRGECRVIPMFLTAGAARLVTPSA
jgi:HK97 family phage major capsid protein